MDPITRLDFWLLKGVQKFSDSICGFFGMSQLTLITLPLAMSINVAALMCHIDLERGSLFIPTTILILVFPLVLLWIAILTKVDGRQDPRLAVALEYIQAGRTWILLFVVVIQLLVIAAMILFPQDGLLATILVTGTLFWGPFVYAPLLLLAMYLLDCKPPTKKKSWIEKKAEQLWYFFTPERKLAA